MLDGTGLTQAEAECSVAAIAWPAQIRRGGANTARNGNAPPRIDPAEWEREDMLYRFFPIDHEGHVHHAPEAHEFTSDHAALRKAQQINARFEIEVWEGRRLIGLVSRRKSAPQRNKSG